MSLIRRLLLLVVATLLGVVPGSAVTDRATATTRLVGPSAHGYDVASNTPGTTDGAGVGKGVDLAPAAKPTGQSAGHVWAVAAGFVAAETSPRLSLDRIRITSGGVDAVERHLNRFVDPGGSLGSAEAGMLARLQKISAGDLSQTSQDIRFYGHELRESVLYRQAGFPTGQPLGADESYALWDALHTAALNDYGFPRAIPPDFLYHPSVLSEPLP